jgi:hypothetical protein
MLQINVIREKATEAEVIVKGITQDIQRLDVAKRNLTGAIQTAERWGMLSELMHHDSSIFGIIQATELTAEHAYSDLKELLHSRRYKEMSSALAVSSFPVSYLSEYVRTNG